MAVNNTKLGTANKGMSAGARDTGRQLYVTPQRTPPAQAPVRQYGQPATQAPIPMPKPAAVAAPSAKPPMPGFQWPPMPPAPMMDYPMPQAPVPVSSPPNNPMMAAQGAPPSLFNMGNPVGANPDLGKRNPALEALVLRSRRLY